MPLSRRLCIVSPDLYRNCYKGAVCARFPSRGLFHPRPPLTPFIGEGIRCCCVCVYYLFLALVCFCCNVPLMRLQVDECALQDENQLLREENSDLQAQLEQLRAWCADQDSFESDVATAIQLAQQSESSNQRQLSKLRAELEAAHDGLSSDDPPHDWREERKRLLLEVRQAQAQLTGERRKARDDGFTERLRAKRSAVRVHGCGYHCRMASSAAAAALPQQQAAVPLLLPLLPTPLSLPLLQPLRPPLSLDLYSALPAGLHERSTLRRVAYVRHVRRWCVCTTSSCDLGARSLGSRR